MATIPSGTKFMGVNPDVNTDERRSVLSNGYQEFFTIEDIADVATDTYYTGIYDLLPYVITPSMINGSIKVIDTPAAPTAFPYNLISKKISGAVTINDSSSIIYLGTVEATNEKSGNALFGPAKITGMVDTYDNNLEAVVDSAFGAGALVSDAVTQDLVPMTRMNIVADVYAPNSFDLYLYTLASTENDVACTVAFEYEFLFIEGSEVTFIVD